MSRFCIAFSAFLDLAKVLPARAGSSGSDVRRFCFLRSIVPKMPPKMALKSSQNAPETSPDGPQASQNLKKTVLLVVLGTSENHLDALLGPGLSFSAIFSQNGAKKLPKCSQSLPFALFVLPFSLHFLSKRPPHPQTRHAPMSADPLTLLTPRATDPQTHRPLRPTDPHTPQTHRPRRPTDPQTHRQQTTRPARRVGGMRGALK